MRNCSWKFRNKHCINDSLIKNTQSLYSLGMICFRPHTPSITCNILIKRKKKKRKNKLSPSALCTCSLAQIISVLWKLSKNIVKKSIYPRKKTLGKMTPLVTKNVYKGKYDKDGRLS
jgi:hypothetical protein